MKLGLTAVEVGEAMGISRSHMVQVEKAAQPRPGTVARYERALEACVRQRRRAARGLIRALQEAAG